MNDAEEELQSVDIMLENSLISEIGYGLEVGRSERFLADQVVIRPGPVNTHHHLSQTLTRAVLGGQDAFLFGLAKLARSGCTLSSDHLCLYPNCARLEDTIGGAKEVGLRFHPTRGAM